MSFQNKGFWMGKVADGNSRFDNPSRIEPKRPHQWFVDAAQPELFPNKKQALETHTTASSSGILNVNVASWNNISSFQSVSNQFTHHLFGPARTCSANFSEQTICPETDDSNASISLSTSHTMDDPEGLSYGSLRKVKVNQVKDSDDNMHDLKGPGFSSNIPSDQAFNGENESSFISIGQPYDKEDNNITLMGHNYHGDSHIVSANPTSVSEAYGKEEANMISFGRFHNPHDIMPVGRPIGGYDQFYEQSSLQTAEAVQEKEVDVSNANVASNNTRVTKSKPESVSRSKSEVKSGRKEVPNSFPSNVRSLISTGMLDGVPVKYMASSRQELRGIIKGSGYLCGCESCNYAKVLNAYEFERHAGCKTKHPNNHIYFENGKTIYQIVQELRNTPETMLFDAIQTVFGAPINQKSFHIWKESFQAATRELQRIYGKEELNL